MFINFDHADPVQADRVVDHQLLADFQDRGAGGVSSNPERGRDLADRQALHDPAP